MRLLKTLKHVDVGDPAKNPEELPGLRVGGEETKFAALVLRRVAGLATYWRLT